MKFRELRADEIDVRVQSVKDNGCVLLLYKDARCDMNMLDEAVGAENWQRKHYECKGNLFCSVGIQIDGQWIWKDDCGTESNTERQKGESSDSFKRACFNWGIGRELYTSPFIWIPAGKVNIRDKKTFDRFSVEKLEVKEGKITALAIRNNNIKATVYTYSSLSEEKRDCCVCGKKVSANTFEKSMANTGKVYCCKACLEKGQGT